MKIITLSFAILCSLGSAYALENPTVLYIGDSHSYGKLGTVIEKNLSTISPKIVMHASCGATPSTWLGNLKYEKTVCGYWFKEGKTEERLKEHQTPKFGDELAKYRPDVTIIQLGTNIAAGAKPENSAASIKTMMAKISAEGSQCIWIGPPDANSKVVTRKKLKKTNDLLIKLSKENNCQYVDSLKLTIFPEKSSEGIHYPPAMSAAWGEKVSLQLKTIIQAFK